jgi:hypothetical protein
MGNFKYLITKYLHPNTTTKSNSNINKVLSLCLERMVIGMLLIREVFRALVISEDRHSHLFKAILALLLLLGGVMAEF